MNRLKKQLSDRGSRRTRSPPPLPQQRTPAQEQRHESPSSNSIQAFRTPSPPEQILSSPPPFFFYAPDSSPNMTRTPARGRFPVKSAVSSTTSVNPSSDADEPTPDESIDNSQVLVDKMVAGAKKFRVVVMTMRAEPPEYTDNYIPLYETLTRYKQEVDTLLERGGLVNRGLSDTSFEAYVTRLKAVSTRLGSHLSKFKQYRDELHPPLPTCIDSCPLRRVLRMVSTAADTDQQRDPSAETKFGSKQIFNGSKRSKLPTSPYEPLRPWQTRLIKLEPWSTTESRLSCRLFSVEFIDMEGVGVTGSSDVVNYTALSYSWGNEEWTDEILCNGHALPIPKALAEFLCQMRGLDTIPYLWCDAICINQADNVEKALQVRNMLRIFEKAHEVIGWIGEPERTEFSIFSTLFNYGDYVSPSVSDATHGEECSAALRILQEQVWHLSRKPWFTRTWVRQEIFAANHLTVRFGQATCRYTELLWTLNNWLNINVVQIGGRMYIRPEEIPKGFRNFGINESFCALTEHFQHKGVDQIGYRPPAALLPYTCHWLRVLQEGVDFDVTNDRDRVYGVLGIIQSPTTRLYVEDRQEIRTSQFPLSYDKSVSEVYQDVVKYLINVEHNLDVLCAFQDRRKQANDLPSWAIDWRVKTKRSFVISVPPRLTEKRMRFQTSPQDFADIGRLRLQGFSPWERIDMLRIIDHKDRDLSFLPGWQSQSPGGHVYPDVPEHDFNLKDVLFGGAYVMSHLKLHNFSGVDKTNAISSISNTDKDTNKDTNKKNDDEKAIDDQPLAMFVPRTTMLDDIVVRFKGSLGFHIVRETEKPGEYTLVGSAWVTAPTTAIYVDRWEETLVMDTEGAPDWARHTWHDYVLV